MHFHLYLIYQAKYKLFSSSIVIHFDKPLKSNTTFAWKLTGENVLPLASKVGYVILASHRVTDDRIEFNFVSTVFSILSISVLCATKKL